MNRVYSGRAREALARAVEDARAIFLANNPRLSKLEAHRMAIDKVLSDSPEIVKLYRQDTD